MWFGYVIMRLSLWIFLGLIIGLFPFKEATATFLGLAIWAPVGLLRRKSSTATVNKKGTKCNLWSMETQCHITWLLWEYYKISHGYHMILLPLYHMVSTWLSHDSSIRRGTCWPHAPYLNNHVKGCWTVLSK